MDYNMVLPKVVDSNRIDDVKKYTYFAGNFGGHADATVQCRVHCLMDYIQCFTRSHWMPSLGKCLRHIAPAATMVINFK
jgi:hypothetical protein